MSKYFLARVFILLLALSRTAKVAVQSTCTVIAVDDIMAYMEPDFSDIFGIPEAGMTVEAQPRTLDG